MQKGCLTEAGRVDTVNWAMYFFTDFIFCFINDRERLGEKCMDFEMEGVRA